VFCFCVNLIQVIGEDPGGGPFTITVSVEGNGHFMYEDFLKIIVLLKCLPGQITIFI
jgi:hypothetical protein